jgi:hypothetical protein
MGAYPETVVRTGRALALEPALSWSAIIAGALVALAASILLTLLAAGFGYDLAFGGLPSRASDAAFTPLLGAGAVLIQVISAMLGGYLAGRLRHQWTSSHTDEAHFRDTAQGLIMWALATVAGVVVGLSLLGPYAATMALATTPPADLSPAATAAVLNPTAQDAARQAHIAAQAALFTAIGMLLSAFMAAVTARIGGLRSEEMHARAAM